VAEAGTNPLNLIPLPFSVAEAIQFNRAAGQLKVQRATLPRRLPTSTRQTAVRRSPTTASTRSGSPASPSRYTRAHGVGARPGHARTGAGVHREEQGPPRPRPAQPHRTYYDKNTGKSDLDITVVVPREEGISLGQKYNQKSVFDLEKFEDIPTGGTGDPIEGLPAEVDRLPRAKMKAYPDELQTLVDQGQQASDRLLRWYRGSPYSKDRGAIGADKAASLEDVTDTSFRFKPKLKMPVSDQAIRFNLAREAASNIQSAEGPLTKAEWTAKAVEKYGPRVVKHVNQAWASATKAIERRYLAIGRKDLPGVDHWAGLVEHGKEAEPFYGPARASIDKVFGPDAEKFLDFYAATSPRTDTDRNLQQALRWYTQWKSGSPIEGGLFPKWARRSRRTIRIGAATRCAPSGRTSAAAATRPGTTPTG